MKWWDYVLLNLDYVLRGTWEEPQKQFNQYVEHPKACLKELQELKKVQTRENLLNMIDINENFIESNFWKNNSLNFTSLNMIIFLVC
jgi:hypothetical protein